MKRIPFGVRVYVMGLLTFFLVALIHRLCLSWQLPIIKAAFTNAFYYSVGLAYVIVLGKILKAQVRSFYFLLFILGAVYFISNTLQSFYKLSNALEKREILNEWDSISLFGWYYILPLFCSFSSPLFMYWWAWFKEHPSYRLYLEGLGGAAKFGSIRSFRRHPANLKTSLFAALFRANELITSSNIFIGRTLLRHDPTPRMIGIDGEVHMVSVAPSRTGKSLFCANPIMASWAGHMVILDVKGEHSKNIWMRGSKEFWEKEGYKVPDGVTKHLPNGKVVIYDPCGITSFKSAQYSFSSEIGDIHAPNAMQRVNAVVEAIVLKEKQKHFEEIPKKILKALIVYVFARFPNQPEKHSLSYILDLLTGINKEGFADVEGLKNLLIDLLVVNACGGICQQAATLLMQQGEKERGGHLGVVSRALESFGHPAIRKTTSARGFDFSSIGKEVDENGHPIIYTIVLVIPDTELESLMRNVRLMLSMAILNMRKLHHIVYFLLDELMLLGHLPIIPRSFALMAGYGQLFHILTQSLDLLSRTYPDFWNTILANSTVQFFGQSPMDEKPLLFISKALGKHNITQADVKGFGSKKSDSPRELLTPFEIAILIGKGTNRQIVFPASGGFPLLLERIAHQPNISVGKKRFNTLPMDIMRGCFPKWDKPRFKSNNLNNEIPKQIELS